MTKIPRMRFFFLSIIIGLLLFSSDGFAQVTIGSGQAPAKGALLDLTEGSITTKGLGLPRVKLSDLKVLKMGDHDLTGSEEEHVGLLVYSAIEQQKCPTDQSIFKGPYVWTGENWEALGKNNKASDVMQFNDQDGNPFLARQFGSAGIWMIENLRATKFDPVRDGVDAREIELRGPMFFTEGTNGGTEAYPALWMYPMLDGADVVNDDLFKQNPSMGLLYTRGAADRGIEDAGSQDIDDNTTKVQGICPSGWHLPSLVEWTELENVILAQTSKYSTTPDIGGTILVDDYERSPVQPYIDPCTTFDSKNGTSFAKEFGGFSVLMPGKIEMDNANFFGEAFYFATSIRNHYMSYVIAWSADSGMDKLQLSSNYSSMFLSVRCKKN